MRAGNFQQSQLRCSLTLTRTFGDESGALIMLVALATSGLAGKIGLGAHACGWSLHGPSEQNTDSATALAVARSTCELADGSNNQDAV
jgi:hypothetical protein